MQTATQSEELVVWTERKALEEAKTLFAPYSPKFQTFPCDARSSLGKTSVSVLYLSSSEHDAAVESTLATLRNCKVSTLLVYTPHHSSDFAFRVGTIVGRQSLPRPNGLSNWPHLRAAFEGAQHSDACLANCGREGVIRASGGQTKTRLESGAVGRFPECDCPYSPKRWEAEAGEQVKCTKGQETSENCSPVWMIMSSPRKRRNGYHHHLRRSLEGPPRS